jgi:hypothetical protein
MFFQSLQKVFRKPIYIVIAIVTSTLVFVSAVWLPNLSLIVEVMGHSKIPFSQRLDLPISLLGSITTNFTLFSASYTIAIAVLFGINLAMMIYFLKRKIVQVKKSGLATSFFGITSGVLGMGCASCGSFLLTSLLTFFGVSSILAYLPLGGEEFGIAGVILLIISIYATAKKILNPSVCKLN